MHDFLWIEYYKLDRVCCYSKYLMKINVGFYIKNFFDNYREAKATYKEKTKDISKKKKKSYCYRVPFLCCATCDFLFLS